MNKMILCTDSKNGIGKHGTIPWHSTEDFKHFKKETTGMKLLMGYKTWESLPKKPLPDRMNIVVTSRKVSDDIINAHKDVIFIHRDHLVDFLRYNDNIMIMGGASIYEAALPYVDEIIHSRIDGDFECDTFFNIHSGTGLLKPKSIIELDDGVTVVYYEVSHDPFDFEMVRWI